MTQNYYTIIFLILTGLFPLLCLAQSSNLLPEEASYQVTRITGGITFDGIPDEAAWEFIEALPLVIYRPVFGEAPTEKSIIKIAYDDEYFYASARLFYQNPEQIRAIGKKRDYLSFAPDWFGFTMDSFNDKENAFSFGINPNGARNDGAIKNDLQIGSDINFSWNTFWDAETVMHEDGWTVEVPGPDFQPAVSNGGGKNPDGTYFGVQPGYRPGRGVFVYPLQRAVCNFISPRFFGNILYQCRKFLRRLEMDILYFPLP